jgi:hypothetical protein
MTGALLMHEAKMMPMPIVLATRRDRQGELRSGRESRQIVGDTSGEGSDSHIQVARARMNPLSDRAAAAPMVHGCSWFVASVSVAGARRAGVVVVLAGKKIPSHTWNGMTSQSKDLFFWQERRSSNWNLQLPRGKILDSGAERC